MSTGTQTKSRPIIFHARSIKAILAGTKVQSRRVVTPQPEGPGPSHWYFDEPGQWWTCGNNTGQIWRCPFGSPGDQLWVRETWQDVYETYDGQRTTVKPNAACKHFIEYFATVEDGKHPPRWRSPLHMPRWASRITLEIESVKVEQLWKITEADVLAEGIGPEHLEKNRKFFHKNDVAGVTFSEFWDQTNGHRKGCAWESNPFVWCIAFKLVDRSAEA